MSDGSDRETRPFESVMIASIETGTSLSGALKPVRERSFVAVHCASIPSNLPEAELLGYDDRVASTPLIKT